MLAFLQHTKTGRMDQHSLKKFNKLYILLKYLYLNGFILKVFVQFYTIKSDFKIQVTIVKCRLFICEYVLKCDVLTAHIL